MSKIINLSLMTLLLLNLSCGNKKNNEHEYRDVYKLQHVKNTDSLDVKLFNLDKMTFVNEKLPYDTSKIPFSTIYKTYPSSMAPKILDNGIYIKEQDLYLYEGNLFTASRTGKYPIRIQIGGFSLEDKVRNIDNEVLLLRSKNTDYDFFIEGSYYIGVNRRTKNIEFVGLYVIKKNNTIYTVFTLTNGDFLFPYQRWIESGLYHLQVEEFSYLMPYLKKVYNE